MRVRVALALAAAVAAAAGCGTPQRAIDRAVASPSASPVDRTVARLGEQIERALAAQDAALERGDLAGYLAPAGGDRAVTAALRTRFGSLRAMRVAAFRQTIATGPTPARGPDGQPEWTVEVAAAHCFGVAGCPPETVRFETR